MIQRIQTLFLFLALVLNVLLFVFPLGNVLDGKVNFYITGFSEQIKMPIITTLPLIIFCIIQSILTIITIFSYKKREFQIKLCKVCFFISLLQIGYVLFLLPDYIIPRYYTEDTFNSSFTSFIPVLIMLLYMLSAHFIKKDIILIQSADRIR